MSTCSHGFNTRWSIEPSYPAIARCQCCGDPDGPFVGSPGTWECEDCNEFPTLPVKTETVAWVSVSDDAYMRNLDSLSRQPLVRGLIDSRRQTTLNRRERDNVVDVPSRTAAWYGRVVSMRDELNYMLTETYNEGVLK